MQELKIDPEFANHLPPLIDQEKDQLRASLAAEGCREPITVWEEQTGTIVDGHHRRELCCELGIPFEVKSISFKDRAEVLAFIETNQIGRRNLTPLQARYFRGREYLREKQEHGGQVPKKGSAQNEHSLKTAERIAEKSGVSPATIRRDAELATQLDALPAEERSAILNRKQKLKQKKAPRVNKPAGPSAQANGVALSPLQKMDRIERQLATIEKSRDAMREVLNLSLLSLPQDRMEAALKTAKALRHSLENDIETLTRQLEKVRQKSRGKATRLPAKKKGADSRAAAGKP